MILISAHTISGFVVPSCVAVSVAHFRSLLPMLLVATSTWLNIGYFMLFIFSDALVYCGKNRIRESRSSFELQRFSPMYL